MTDDAAQMHLVKLTHGYSTAEDGYQIAKKYLQGKVEVKAKKAKKDLFGKDKPSEDVTSQPMHKTWI